MCLEFASIPEQQKLHETRTRVWISFLDHILEYVPCCPLHTGCEAMRKHKLNLLLQVWTQATSKELPANLRDFVQCGLGLKSGVSRTIRGLCSGYAPVGWPQVELLSRVGLLCVVSVVDVHVVIA